MEPDLLVQGGCRVQEAGQRLRLQREQYLEPAVAVPAAQGLNIVDDLADFLDRPHAFQGVDGHNQAGVACRALGHGQEVPKPSLDDEDFRQDVL